MSEATGKDAIFFQIILTSMKNKPDVDWAVVAQKSGYKDAKTASTRYGQIMKKLTGVTATQAMAGNSGTVAKVTPKKGKAVKKEVGSGTNTTPSKVTKRAPRKTKKSDIKIEMPDETDDEDELAAESPMDVVKEEEDEDEEEHNNGEQEEEYASAEEEIDA